MSEDIIYKKIEEYLKSTQKEKKSKTIRLSDKAIKGIEIMKILYSRLYRTDTGIEKCISASDIVNLSVQRLTDYTLNQIRQKSTGKKENVSARYGGESE